MRLILLLLPMLFGIGTAFPALSQTDAAADAVVAPAGEEAPTDA